MDCCRYEGAISRRELLAKAGYGLGAAALATLLEKSGSAADKFPNFTPRAKRVIFLFQAGGPSHLDLLDYKPQMKNRFDQDIPASVFGGQRVTGMVAQQDRFPVVPTMYDFHQHGQSGIWLSDLLPHTAKIVDEICLLRAMNTEAINHDPAITFMQTGASCRDVRVWGRGSITDSGARTKICRPSWCSILCPATAWRTRVCWHGYGARAFSQAGIKACSFEQPATRCSTCRTRRADPEQRRGQLDTLSELNRRLQRRAGDPEIETRIAQYEMAFRMQASVPDLTDTSKEPEHVLALYGEDARKPGTFAANCLLARRLAERNVRFIQLYHRGWDHHGGLTQKLRRWRGTSTRRAPG
jgi:hypothetical protein